MYNLKVEAVNIMNILEANGFDTLFIGNYPFVKYHNSCHPDNKYKIKQIEIVTNAKLENLQELFKVTKVNNENYVKSAMIEVEVKQNKVYFKIFYISEYKSVVNGKIKISNTIEEILDNRSFLIETLTMTKDYKISNYSNKKMDTFQSIEQKTLCSNGNFRERVLENPLIILELCYYASNINYQVSDSMLQIITNNCHYLKYESIENITRYVSMILNSKNPIVGLNIIKTTMMEFVYNDVNIFKFFENVSNEHLLKLSDFNSSIDTISRWSYLLLPLSLDECKTVLNNFKISYKNKIVWLLQNSGLIDQENYKMAIYNSRETLKEITESKWDVFLLFQMFDRLTKLYCILDPEKEFKCKRIIDTICSRPFFTYQIVQSNDDICKIANMESGEWVEVTKEHFIKKIIMCDRHPDEDKYLDILKESIEYGLITSL